MWLDSMKFGTSARKAHMAGDWNHPEAPLLICRHLGWIMHRVSSPRAVHWSTYTWSQQECGLLECLESGDPKKSHRSCMVFHDLASELTCHFFICSQAREARFHVMEKVWHGHTVEEHTR